MQPENPPPLPPIPPANYSPPGQYPPPGNPPPGQYPAYAAPPPPQGGTPTWVWILCGCLGGGFVLVVILAAIFFPVFAQAREAGRRSSCMSNLKQIALGNLMYSQDYDEILPTASDWQTEIIPYIKREDVFRCPSVFPGAEPPNTLGGSYAYYSALDMLRMKRLSEPQNTVLVYDSTNLSVNASDALNSLPAPGRHLKKNNIAFADGHATSWPDGEPVPQGEILPDTPDTPASQ